MPPASGRHVSWLAATRFFPRGKDRRPTRRARSGLPTAWRIDLREAMFAGHVPAEHGSLAVPPTKEHIPMRATLTTISAIALLAAGAGSAAARPADMPLHRSDSAKASVYVPPAA